MGNLSSKRSRRGSGRSHSKQGESADFFPAFDARPNEKLQRGCFHRSSETVEQKVHLCETDVYCCDLPDGKVRHCGEGSHGKVHGGENSNGKVQHCGGDLNGKVNCGEQSNGKVHGVDLSGERRHQGDTTGDRILCCGLFDQARNSCSNKLPQNRKVHHGRLSYCRENVCSENVVDGGEKDQHGNRAGVNGTVHSVCSERDVHEDEDEDLSCESGGRALIRDESGASMAYDTGLTCCDALVEKCDRGRNCSDASVTKCDERSGCNGTPAVAKRDTLVSKCNRSPTSCEVSWTHCDKNAVCRGTSVTNYNKRSTCHGTSVTNCDRCRIAPAAKCDKGSNCIDNMSVTNHDRNVTYVRTFDVSPSENVPPQATGSGKRSAPNKFISALSVCGEEDLTMATSQEDVNNSTCVATGVDAFGNIKSCDTHCAIVPESETTSSSPRYCTSVFDDGRNPSCQCPSSDNNGSFNGDKSNSWETYCAAVPIKSRMSISSYRHCASGVFEGEDEGRPSREIRASSDCDGIRDHGKTKDHGKPSVVACRRTNYRHCASSGLGGENARVGSIKPSNELRSSHDNGSEESTDDDSTTRGYKARTTVLEKPRARSMSTSYRHCDSGVFDSSPCKHRSPELRSSSDTLSPEDDRLWPKHSTPCAAATRQEDCEGARSFRRPFTHAVFDGGGQPRFRRMSMDCVLTRRDEEIAAQGSLRFRRMSIIMAADPKQIFHEIDAVEPLKKIASSPNTVASKLAAEALKVIGEKIPHKLSQQVPLWTVEDVTYWVSQIGFSDYVEAFSKSQVDGDLLLILTCEDLAEGIGMTSTILRKRFMRELKSLKITADYSASDPTGLDKYLMGLCPELSQYTYYMLRQGVDTFVLKTLTEQELKEECSITNSIHRRKILQHVADLSPEPIQPLSLSMPTPVGPRFASLDFNSSLSTLGALRPIDVFICYRRSSGSQLASLLKVHLQLRGFSVFLDIDRLRAGKFDENLLLSIQMSQHFVLILTHDALDRCQDDISQEDWVHKEIVAALDCSCNIVPIIDNFEWPTLERLPEDMRGIVRFNCVRWVHEYQDACVDKLETFLRRGRRRMSQQTTPQTTSGLHSSDSHLSVSDFSLRSHSLHSISHAIEDPYPTG